MDNLAFFSSSRTLSLAVIVREGEAPLPDGADLAQLFSAVANLDQARRMDVSVSTNSGSLRDLRDTRAGACFIPSHQAGYVPAGTIALVTTDPTRAFRRVAALFHPDSTRPTRVLERAAIDPAAIIHPEARLEPGVQLDPGVVVGARAEIGSGTTIGANATIGPGVRIGRDCAIAAQVSLVNALLGDRVVVEAGARIGHGGPAPTVPEWRLPYLGRVIVQDDVEIGANAVVIRGVAGDTIIGEGARIDALVVVGGGSTIERRATRPRPEVGEGRG